LDRAMTRTAYAAEIAPAMALVLASNGRPATDWQVGEFFRLTAQRAGDLRNVIVVVIDDKIVWGLLPIISPGRTLMILSPNSLFDAGQYDAAARLISAACAQFGNGRCDLAQVLLDPGADDVRAVYRRAGFMEMARLEYLHSPARKPKNPLVIPAEIELLPYSPETHGYFAQAIRQSYESSLDCPALNGLRDIEDVIQGHRAAGQVTGHGEFDPSLWRVAMLKHSASISPSPCGVLLLCRTDPSEAMELVYLGVAPQARRRGLGTLLIRRALETAAECKCKRLTLAVDSNNQPALHLYYRHGFQKVGSKIALIRDLRDGAVEK
jgi:ribosomal protein S18 acetylase RimI-like enzyme